MAERLLFSKLGRARFISHLDLMRTFQRAFFRAQIRIRHTEGYHPHPFVSIALPLSVGFSSDCEILEFGLEGGAEPEEVPELLNRTLPEGILVHRCYTAQRPLREIAYIRYLVEFTYAPAMPPGAEEGLRALLSRESCVVQKKSKKAKSGFTEVDLIPRIRSWSLSRAGESLRLDALLSAQNPGLNPELIRAALCETYPDAAPDFASFHRRELLDETLALFL